RGFAADGDAENTRRQRCALRSRHQPRDPQDHRQSRKHTLVPGIERIIQADVFYRFEQANIIAHFIARPDDRNYKYLKYLVGVAGFEPATPASRTSFSIDKVQ